MRLIIFDLDDTLISSADTWQQAEARLFARLGHVYDPAIARHYKGMNARDVGRTIHRFLAPAAVSAEECGRLLRGYLLAAFAGPLTPMPGADTLLHALAGRYRLCIASGSPREAIEGVVARCGWQGLFEFVVSSETMAHGKPAPDVFLAAAEQAGYPPAQTLVIEDSLHDARAARAAGMACLVVPSSDDPAIREEADVCLATLADAIPLLLFTEVLS